MTDFSTLNDENEFLKENDEPYAHIREEEEDSTSYII